MYQKKTKKLIKRGSSITRLREARRQLRRQKIKPETESQCVTADDASTDKASQSRLLLELACKTIALMHNNRVIQQKIVALQKETSDFLASIVDCPESKQYHEKFWLYGLALRSQSQSLSQQIKKTKALTNDVTLTQL